MITESMALWEIKSEIGIDVFKVFPPEYYMEIINNKTLPEFSTHYPFLQKNINIYLQNGIRTVHPQTGKSCIYRYKIPKENEEDVFINVEQFYYPGNLNYSQTWSNAPILNGAMRLIGNALPNAAHYAALKYTVLFYPPDILEISPPPMNHVDFVVCMQRMCRLHEIPMYYRSYFLALAVCDVKIALYNRFKNLKDGVNYQGLEISTYISDFQEAKSERQELVDKFRKDWFKDPSRLSGMLQFID
jgi:hypothetical protein